MSPPVPFLPELLTLPEKTVSGRNKILTLLPECRRFGERGILLHGAALEQGGWMSRVLAAAPAGMAICPLRHGGGEPTLDQVAEITRLARETRADWIAGVGGGSVMDLAKAAAALARAPLSPAHYHEGGPIPESGLVFIAAPTTAGTGSEATLNSVLTNSDTGVKKSIRAPAMMARVVILDPALLAVCPGPVIAASGMDALTQAIEAYTSRHAVWLSDTLALQATRLIADNLRSVHRDPSSAGADPLLTGSYLAGIALSFARLGVVHGLAHPLGALYHAPHGAVCAACLPHAIELNRKAMGAKYDALGQMMGGDLHGAVRDLMRQLGLVSPFAGQPLHEKERIIRETLASGSTQANPKAITRADVEWLLARLFEQKQGKI